MHFKNLDISDREIWKTLVSWRNEVGQNSGLRVFRRILRIHERFGHQLHFDGHKQGSASVPPSLYHCKMTDSLLTFLLRSPIEGFHASALFSRPDMFIFSCSTNNTIVTNDKSR